MRTCIALVTVALSLAPATLPAQTTVPALDLTSASRLAGLAAAEARTRYAIGDVAALAAEEGP